MKPYIMAILLAANLMAAATPAHAASDFLLDIEGIKGETNDKPKAYSFFSLGFSGALIPLDDVMPCNGFGAGSFCRLAGGELPGIFTDPATPTELIFQPGSRPVVLGFTAPEAGAYRVNYLARLLGDGSSGVALGEGFGLADAPDIMGVGILLPAIQRAREAAFALEKGDSFFLSFTSSGDPAFDRVGLSMRVTAVPEPASWAMMITGFGLTGAVIRRRRTLAVVA
jgi:hypothetical protein